MDAELIRIAGWSLFAAFVLYLLASVCYVLVVTGKNFRQSKEEADHDHSSEPDEHSRSSRKATFARWGIILTISGFVLHVLFSILRWAGQGHAPVSTMFEFIVFLALMTTLGYIILFFIYKARSLGAFALPLVVTLLGWAAVFDTDPSPLIPALQSYWLPLHVSTTSLGQGLFAVGFAAGLMYLIRTVPQTKPSLHTRLVELTLLGLCMLVAFIVLSNVFSAVGYEVEFNYVNEQGEQQLLTYELPAIAGPYEGTQLSDDRMSPIVRTPSWMQGVDAPRKFNTVLWGILAGLVLYTIIRLIVRKRIGAVMQPWLSDLKPTLLDEISYRAIAISFPIFTLGGLVFAMIWAEQAWGRFWGWDPKEVWALITWLVYAVYLHLRLSKGWHGERSAWLVVIGFAVVMFNLIFINLVVAGLHSYVSG